MPDDIIPMDASTNSESIDEPDDDTTLLSDITAFGSLTKHVLTAMTYMSPKQLNDTYQSVRPAMEKVSRGTMPEELDPQQLEAAAVWTANPAERVQEIKAARKQGPATQSQESRVGQPFDPTNPIDAQFLGPGGIPTFTDDNYKAYLATRGLAEDTISALSSTSGNDITNRMKKMSTQEQIAVVDMMATIAKNEQDQLQAQEKSDPLRLTPSAQTELQKNINDLDQKQQQLAIIDATYKDEYLQFTGKTTKKISQELDKINKDWTSEEKEKYIADFTEWQSSVEQVFLTYRKEITGVQFKPEEITDLKKAILNSDLSPAQYKGMRRAMETNIKVIREAKYQILSSGKIPTADALKKLTDGKLISIYPDKQVNGPFAEQNNASITTTMKQQFSAGTMSDNTVLNASKAIAENMGRKWEDYQPDVQQQILRKNKEAWSR